MTLKYLISRRLIYLYFYLSLLVGVEFLLKNFFLSLGLPLVVRYFDLFIIEEVLNFLIHLICWILNLIFLVSKFRFAFHNFIIQIGLIFNFLFFRLIDLSYILLTWKVKYLYYRLYQI